MRNVITDAVVLPATADRLFEMYLDPAQHASFTGFPVTIGAVAGAKFEAFEGQLSGQILQLVESRLIVQSWRSTQFRDEDPDSTLILSFTPAGDQGRIDLVHLDVPDHDVDGVTQGWQQFYWTPWSEWLKRR
ncbi:MAG: SRPBCC domain-containing protein [Bythopirellula sp.]